jgi:hypothetical protein
VRHAPKRQIDAVLDEHRDVSAHTARQRRSGAFIRHQQHRGLPLARHHIVHEIGEPAPRGKREALSPRLEVPKAGWVVHAPIHGSDDHGNAHPENQGGLLWRDRDRLMNDRDGLFAKQSADFTPLRDLGQVAQEKSRCEVRYSVGQQLTQPPHEDVCFGVGNEHDPVAVERK